MRRNYGATRSFGLNQAIPLIGKAKDKLEVESACYQPINKYIWIDWYTSALKTDLDTVALPSTDLLNTIEAGRKRAMQ